MQIPSLRVEGKVAFVTGAGTGLGQASAVALADAGADIALTELPGKETLAQETVRLVETAGRRALALPLDVTKMPMISDAVEQTLKHFGHIDILVNNAGINIPRLALEVSEDDWDRVLDVNLKGVFFVAQAVARRALVPQDGGKIINIASQNGVIGYFYRAAYCSSKAGVVNLTRVLALEWAKYHINVNAIGPTFLETPLTKPMFENAEFKADVLSRIPLGRIGRPEDVVGAVVYLASPAADLVTGHTLLVDGGWTAV
jgi:2-dehydro-3-deoxy-D-gluconate 5-dehydrogenase